MTTPLRPTELYHGCPEQCREVRYLRRRLRRARQRVEREVTRLQHVQRIRQEISYFNRRRGRFLEEQRRWLETPLDAENDIGLHQDGARRTLREVEDGLEELRRLVYERLTEDPDATESEPDSLIDEYGNPVFGYEAV